MKKNKTAIQLVTGGVFAGAVILCAVAGYVYGSRPTIGILDIGRVREEAVLFQKVGLEQQKYEALLKNQVTVIQDILENDIKNYKEQEKSFSKEEQKKAQTALEEKAAVLQARYREQAAQIKTISTQVGIRLDALLNETMTAFAAEKGYQVVLPKEVTVFADKAVDGTTRFIQLFNEKTAALSYADLTHTDDLSPAAPAGKLTVAPSNEQPTNNKEAGSKPQEDDIPAQKPEQK